MMPILNHMGSTEHSAMGIRYAELTGADVAIEPCPKRVRVFFGGEAVADTRRVMLLHERGHLPVYYFPLEDVRQDLLVESERSYHCPRKGDARFWSVQVADRSAHNAAWNYPEPIEGCPDISNLVAFYWTRMDAWYDEDEEVFVHARDPYKRIDVLESSRQVVVQLNGVTLAESHRPVLLFETGLPVRYYLPKLALQWEHLTASDVETACPYKGTTTGYWAAEVDGETKDVAWCYENPLPEVAKIAGRVAFFNERVDLVVDGEQEQRPRTKWSR